MMENDGKWCLEWRTNRQENIAGPTSKKRFLTQQRSTHHSWLESAYTAPRASRTAQMNSPLFYEQIRTNQIGSVPAGEIRFSTWWFIPLSKWVITPVTNGISRVNPLITGVITHLLSGMSHQAGRCHRVSGVSAARGDFQGPLQLT